MADVNRELTMPRVEPDTESQKQRKRHLRENNDPRGAWVGLSNTDVPKRIRNAAGSQMNQIQLWPNQHIVDTVQQFGDAMEVGENVQIP